MFDASNTSPSVARELASNMTSLVRSKYSIDDRINRAWFINPGNAWTTPRGSPAQSVLQLSDKIIAVAIIALVDDSGRLVRRRLLTTETSGSESPARGSRALLQEVKKITAQNNQDGPSSGPVPTPVPVDKSIPGALQAITDSPREGALPPIDYHVDVGKELATALGVAGSPGELFLLHSCGDTIVTTSLDASLC